MARWSIHGWPGRGTGPSSQPSNRPPSSAHSYSAASFDENVNAALVLVVDAFGPETIVVSGRLVSVTQLHSSGVVSRMPSGVTERTSSMCSPSGRAGASYGDEQMKNGPRSMAHSNVEPPTVDENWKRAGPLMISASGPTSIVVSGASTTVNRHWAGDGSALTVESFGSTSTARTRNRCSPRPREASYGCSHCSNRPPSMAHSKVAPRVLALKAKATVASAPASGSIPAVGSG